MYPTIRDTTNNATGYQAYKDGGWRGVTAFFLEIILNRILDYISIAFPVLAPFNIKFAYTNEGGWSFGVGYGLEDSPIEISSVYQERGKDRGIKVGCSLSYKKSISDSLNASYNLGVSITVNENGINNYDTSTGVGVNTNTSWKIASDYGYFDLSNGWFQPNINSSGMSISTGISLRDGRYEKFKIDSGFSFDSPIIRGFFEKNISKPASDLFEGLLR